MTFAISTDDLEYIPSWLAADTYFQQTKAIRGTDKSYVPLRECRRDHKYKNLRKCTDDQGNIYYAARLYSTDLIEYHRDHIIINTATSWTTASSIAFIQAVSPQWLCTWTHKDRFWMRIAGSPIFTPDMTRRLKIMVDPIEGYRPIPQTLEVGKVEMRRVDRKAANQLYKPMKEYFEWAKAMDAMEAMDQMVAIALDYPVEASAHEKDGDGVPLRSFWHVERDFIADGERKLAELVSQPAISPDDFPKILTYSLGMARGLRGLWRPAGHSKLFYVESNAKANKTWLQKFMVYQAKAYKWEYRPNDNGFPSQPFRVSVSEQMRVGE